ncbi:MAG: nitroreductase [Chitinophagaceae bacterium]
MNTEAISIITDTIRQRRSTKPDKMNGQKIADAQMETILETARWAPTHGGTEPWHFIVYAGSSVTEFCRQHAVLYRSNTAAESYLQGTYDKFFHLGDLASHMVVAIMCRGNLPKIPVWEEVAAAACAIQNILLTATAMKIASFWSTGGMAMHPAMKEYLQLREDDQVMGFLYFGYSNTTTEGNRSMAQDKITWAVNS